MNQRYVMGTFLTVSIVGDDSTLLTQIFLNEIQRLEVLLSKYRPDSDVSAISRSAGHHAVTVSEDTFHIIAEACRFAAQSHGAFDPTLQPQGYRQIQRDSIKQTIFLAQQGMSLDLGAIGKGFALDQALARVQAAGTPESVTADFGGQLLFWHRDGIFAPETILIENPLTRGTTESIQIASNCSISTSSNTERPGHLRNPLTGESAQKHRSVTVVARTGTEAEALSTAFFVEGRVGTYNLI